MRTAVTWTTVLCLLACGTAEQGETSQVAGDSEPSAVTSCSNEVPVEGCRSSDACMGNEICRAPPSADAPGPVQVPLVPCGDDSVCPAEQSCNGTYCVVQHCAQGYVCADDERCNPSASANPNHGCEPKPCSVPGGVACDWWLACSPELEACVGVPCRADDDCGCGFCTWFGSPTDLPGLCAPSLGGCVPPDPSPPPG